MTRDEVVNFILAVTGDKEMAAAAATVLKAGQAAGISQEEFDKLSKSLTDLASKSALIQKALSQKAGLSDLTSQLKDAQTGLDKLRAEFDQTDTSSKKVTKAFSDAEKAVASLTAQQTAASVALQKTEGALQKAGVDTSDLGKAFQKVQADGNAAATALGKVGSQGETAGKGTKNAAEGTKQLNDEADRSGNVLTLLADNLGKVITVAAAVKLALAGIDFGVDSFQNASRVEGQLARVQATAEATRAAFEKFGPAISAAAEQVNVSTDQAAQALAALAQQGQSADEALLSLVPTLQLAKIAQIDVATAAGLVDDALDRFGLTAKDAGQVVDILVAASKGAKEGLTGIAQAMQQIAPLARDAGLSFKDTAAILGDLQQNGFDAGNAVRGLRAIFEQLSDPASKLRVELAKLGDTGGDFSKAVDTIASSGDDGRRALLELDGASRVLLTFLAQQGVGALQKFSAGLDQSAGAASRVVRAINETAGGAFDALTNSIDRAAEDLAKPFLAPVADELRILAAEINDFAKSKDFEEIKNDLTSLARDAVTALDKLIHGLKWQDLRDGATDAVGGLKDDFHSLAEDADAVVSAISKVTAAITVVKNLGDVGGDIGQTIFGSTSAAAVGAALAVSKAKDSITGDVSATTKALQSLFDQLSATAGRGISGLAQDTNEGTVALRKLTSAASEAGPAFRSVQSGAATTAASFKNVESNALSTAGVVKELTVSLGDVAKKGVPAVSALDDATKRLGKSQADLAAAASQSGKDLDTIFAGFLAGSKTIEDVRAAFAKYQSDLRASVANSADWKKQTVEDTLDVKAAALGISDAFSRLGDDIPRPDLAPVRDAFNQVQRAAGDAAGALEEEIKGAEEAARNVSGALGNALSAQAAFLSEFGGTSAAAVERFTKLTEEFFNGAHIFSQAAITDATGIIKFGEAIADAGRQVESEIESQRQGVAALAQQYVDMSDAALAAEAKQAGGTDRLLANLQGTAAAAREGSSAFDLLGASDLSGLASALDSAAAKVDALKQKAEDAKAALEDIGRSIQDQIDEINDNQAAIENRRFEDQLQQIKDQAAAAGTLNSAETNKLIDEAKRLHELKLKQIQEEADARKKADQDNTGDTGAPNAPKPVPTPPNPTEPPPTAPKPTPLPAPTLGSGGITINLNISGPAIIDQKAFDDFVRKIKAAIEDINNRSK